jgi:hypothetical protein
MSHVLQPYCCHVKQTAYFKLQSQATALQVVNTIRHLRDTVFPNLGIPFQVREHGRPPSNGIKWTSTFKNHWRIFHRFASDENDEEKRAFSELGIAKAYSEATKFYHQRGWIDTNVAESMSAKSKVKRRSKKEPDPKKRKVNTVPTVPKKKEAGAGDGAQGSDEKIPEWFSSMVRAHYECVLSCHNTLHSVCALVLFRYAPLRQHQASVFP